QRAPEMSSVPPLKKCSTFLRLATSDTASATPEDQGPIMKRAPSPSIASAARRCAGLGGPVAGHVFDRPTEDLHVALLERHAHAPVIERPDVGERPGLV